MGDYWSLFQSMGILIFIILLAFLTLRYGLKSIYRGFNGNQVKVIEKTIIDPKNSSCLVLVQVGDEVLLIGTAQGGVTLLKTYNRSELNSEKPVAYSGEGNFKQSFSRVLKNFLKKEDGGSNAGGGS